MDLFDIQNEVFDRTWRLDDKFFTMNALLGELGELANILKKEEYFKSDNKSGYRNRVLQEIYDKQREPFDGRILDELGDVMFYYFQLVNACGFNADQVWEKQLEKLKRQDVELNEGNMYLK